MRVFWNSQSPFARKVRICLLEKSAAFEAVEIATATQREELRRVSPRAEVPVLVEGACAIAGSREICDYLEARFPEPALLPREPAKRARVAALERISDEYADALQFLLHLASERRPDLSARFPALRGALEQASEQLYALLDAELGAGDYFAGDFSRADVALVTQVTSLVSLLDGAAPRQARLGKWLARMLARDSVRRDAREALAAVERDAHEPEPFFARDSIHWRDTRVEFALRFGLGAWLLEEIQSGRAFFSPAPR
jgi:glutathione S-transferase